MENRRTWAWIVVWFCVMLCLQAGMAEEAETLIPQEAVTAGDAQIIDAGVLPDSIQKLLETAIAEIGYTEGANNYSKYGAWTGDPNAQWCAEFVCWCVHMTDQLYGYDMLETVFPYYTGQNTGRDWFVSRGRFVYRRGYAPGWGYQWLINAEGMMEENDYIPYPGDFMYFSANSSSNTTHVALVEYCAYDADGNVLVHVIEGNNPSSVKRAVYALDNSQVLGFGCWNDVVDTTISFGNSGDKVLQLQQNLGKLGLLSERHFTSTFLTNTRNAVSAFQEDVMGITPTGVAGYETQHAIQYEVDKIELYEPDAWVVTSDTNSL